MTDPAARREPSDRGTEPAVGPTTDANVAQSVQAATQALHHLEQSMRAAGFPEGTTAYERMAEVLLAQWVSQGLSNAERRTDFERLGEIAGRIFGMLHPYTVVMRRLAALAPNDSERARAAVVAELHRRGRRGASPAVLARATGLAPSIVDAALARLVDDRAVQPRGTGAARTFVVTEPTDVDTRRRRRPPRPASGRPEPARTVRAKRGQR
jgi:phage tail tape-measure protein